MSNYVIIGNGVAAVGCIEGIRREDKLSPITVISKEEHPVYCRPLISYYLEGKTSLSKMNYRDEDFYTKNGCDVLYGKSAVKIDAEGHTVTLDDSSQIQYTSLCVASGSSPIILPIPGLESVERRFTFMTLDDALALEKAISKDSRVLIIGAGLIGLKCAEGICERVGSVTVCDLAPRVLSSILDNECASLMQKKLEEHQINFLLSDTVERFENNVAFMKSQKSVKFDVLVMAVGVRPNFSIVKEAGGETSRGILVNEHMESSLCGVYAAGDCTEGTDISLGQRRVIAILPNAYMQGRCAGINMAGGDDLFDKGIPMNSIGFFGLHAMSAGSYFDAPEGELYEEKSEGKIRRLYTRGGYLTGFMFVGDTNRVGIYTSLIRERTPLDSINFDLLKKISTFTAFSSETRGKKFGGVV